MGRVHKSSNFGAIPNKLLYNSKISWKAKGLYGYINAKPHDWDFSVERTSVDSTDGKDSTRSGIQELEKNGYLERVKTRLQNGKIQHDWILHWEPIFVESTIAENPPTENPPTENPPTENPPTENPPTENPPTENPPTNKERDTKKDKQIKIKKEIYIDDSIIILDFQNKDLQKAWEDFQKYRQEMKKKMTDTGREALKKKLQSYPPEVATKMLEESMANGWQGVFELKESNNQHKSTIRDAIANHKFI